MDPKLSKLVIQKRLERIESLLGCQVSPALLQVLTNNRLELDRFPKDFRRLQESLELFLDRKAMFT